MSNVVEGFELYRLCVPLGRTIGDNNCTYNAFDVVALSLLTDGGLVGWGFGEKAHGGQFRIPVSWKAELPPLAEMQACWLRYWQGWKGHTVEDLLEATVPPWLAGQLPNYLQAAFRMALWDLAARLAGRSLCHFLGGPTRSESAAAYLSLCEFPQSVSWLRQVLPAYANAGFTYYKFKVGHPDPEVDFTRLRAVREILGSSAAIAVDANIAWNAPQTLAWVARAEREGLGLAYLEDPLPPKDLEGYRQLAKDCPLPIAGHDYLPNPEALRPVLDTGALRWLRIRDGIDHGLALLRLADTYDLGVFECNTFGEHALHVGLTSPRMQRVEFADLGWNQLFQSPVSARAGQLHLPPGLGHGLVPRPELLTSLAAP